MKVHSFVVADDQATALVDGVKYVAVPHHYAPKDDNVECNGCAFETDMGCGCLAPDTGSLSNRLAITQCTPSQRTDCRDIVWMTPELALIKRMEAGDDA